MIADHQLGAGEIADASIRLALKVWGSSCLKSPRRFRGHGFSFGAVPGAARPKSSLQCRSHPLSGTKPCWRKIHFWTSWSVAPGRIGCWSLLWARGLPYSRSILRILILWRLQSI